MYCISVWFYRSLKNLIRKFRYEEADEASRLHGCMLYHSASRTMVEVCIDENFQQILCLVQTDHKPASQNIIIILTLRTNIDIIILTITTWSILKVAISCRYTTHQPHISVQLGSLWSNWAFCVNFFS